VIEAVHGRVVLPALVYIQFGSRALARNGQAQQNGATTLQGGSKNHGQLGRIESQKNFTTPSGRKSHMASVATMFSNPEKISE
jgi:hypothetical protein